MGNADVDELARTGRAEPSAVEKHPGEPDEAEDEGVRDQQADEAAQGRVP
jgi:hypothetical protein